MAQRPRQRAGGFYYQPFQFQQAPEPLQEPPQFVQPQQQANPQEIEMPRLENLMLGALQERIRAQMELEIAQIPLPAEEEPPPELEDELNLLKEDVVEWLAPLEKLRSGEAIYEVRNSKHERGCLYQAGEMLLFLEFNANIYVQHRAGEMWFEADGALRDRLRALLGAGFFGKLQDKEDEVETRTAQMKVSMEAVADHHRSLVFWGLRVAELREQLEGLTGIQGVKSVALGSDRIQLVLDHFTSRIEVPGHGWLDCEIDGELHICDSAVLTAGTKLIIPKLGAFTGLPICNRRGNWAICLDAGEVNYTMAMRAGNPVEAILGVLAQLRKLDNNGYTKNEAFVAESQRCSICGMGRPALEFLPTRGGACPTCSAPCASCKKPLVANRSTSRTPLSGRVHLDCAEQCIGCERMKGIGLECPDCGPNPKPAVCSKCGKQSEGLLLLMWQKTPGTQELRCPQCYMQCSRCGSGMAMPEKKSITRCHSCRKICMVCGKICTIDTHPPEGNPYVSACYRRCTAALHFNNYVHGAAKNRDGGPAMSCASCNVDGFWIPLQRYEEGAQSGAEEASEDGKAGQAREERGGGPRVEF